MLYYNTVKHAFCFPSTLLEDDNYLVSISIMFHCVHCIRQKQEQQELCGRSSLVTLPSYYKAKKF